MKVKVDFTSQYEKQNECIKHLWKSNDKEWLARRAQDFKLLKQYHFNDVNKKELKLYANYFAYGEQTEHIDGKLRFILTPLNSPEDALLLYESCFDDSMKKRVYIYYLIILK